jgi:hypothetical protein
VDLTEVLAHLQFVLAATVVYTEAALAAELEPVLTLEELAERAQSVSSGRELPEHSHQLA